MDANIRTATEADVDAVLALWREADAIASVSDDPESVRRLLSRDPDALLIAETAGRLIGTIVAGWDGWRGAIYRLAVAPDHRRRGVASALVRASEERLVALGARRIGAIVVHEHDHAIAFWRALGYEHDARVVRYVKTFL